MQPQELVEIHEIGAEMEKHRRTLEHIQVEAATAGEEAVKADRARRTAAEAKRKGGCRTQSPAHRGRRPPPRHRHRLRWSRCLSTAARPCRRFCKTGIDALPSMRTPADLAAVLGLTIPRLRWLAFHTEVATRTHYVRFTVPKKNGGVPGIGPAQDTRSGAALDFQQHPQSAAGRCSRPRLCQGPQYRQQRPSARGPGRAHQLRSGRLFSQAFPSLRLRNLFQRASAIRATSPRCWRCVHECPRREIRYEDRTYFVATGPRAACPRALHKPRGFANQVMRRLDCRLAGLAKLDTAYTRYADDLTLSAWRADERAHRLRHGPRPPHCPG